MAEQNPSTATLDTEARITPDVKIEDVSPVKKRLTITVPAEAIAEKLDAQLNMLIAETAVPGFRKGHAPRSLMQKRFGSAVKEETRNQIISEAFSSAVEKHGIKTLGDPEPVTKVEDLKIEDGKPLSFQVDVEVMPEFDLPSLDGIEVKKPKLDITDETIENELERQRLRFGEAHKIEGDFQSGDRLTCHGSATRKGEDEPFFTHDEILVVYPGDENNGRGQVVGLLVENLAKSLKGKAVGETFIVDTTVPENHEREDIRGKDISIELQVRHAERVSPADLEDIAKNFGMDSVDMLRKQITSALEQKRDQEQAQVMRDQVFEQLADAVDFPVPDRLSAAQAARIVRQREMELLYQGLNPEEVEAQLAEFRAQSETIANNRLKLFFLLHRLAEEFKVQVTEPEINGRIAQIAVMRGMRPEVLRNELANAGRVHEVAMMLRDEKVADRVIGQSKVKEITTAEWRKELATKTGGAGKREKSSDASTEKKPAKKPAAKSEAKTTKKKTTKKA